MLTDYTGWTKSTSTMFEQAGKLAGGVKMFFSGETNANREAQKKALENQKASIQNAELAAMTKTTEKIDVWAWVQKNWLYLTIGGVLLLLLIFIKPIMRMFGLKKKSNIRKYPRRIKMVRKTVSRTRKKTTGFNRKIHGRTYTSAKSWANAMRNLRKK
jgi:hypothetical protein